MAEPGSPLAQLADISEPELVLGFALAPIWWLLIAALALALFYLALRVYRRRCYFAPKRQALLLLEQIHHSGDDATQINQLIKRVLRHYQPTHPALSMDSKHWQQWLATQCTVALPDLTGLLYQRDDNNEAKSAFYLFAKAWLSGYQAKAPLPTSKAEVKHA
ncbi:MAG: hypothetical protein CL577_03190 [Alteromonadaceae bacterium]|jgi:hypothetical protein|uniref:DUF4381 domain-containing protein n=1 Tax=Rheinheimera aquimaris TaxID=412437 RepID=UPI000C6236AB|nr:DUF4381 domain-containing protein [Rheinheimera aquimaris]MBJ91597.1 hypothetical protein [Alteromonadaceae bacterium]HBN87875.1 DUF4381 domain-containing protein [Rheinheimera sp.]|tara:strand:- start:180 stop:665 length:486 start_codon:yes stop_codon:yes gene_type:complete